MQVQCQSGEKAEETGSKTADSDSTLAPRNLHPPPGFEHNQAAASRSGADTLTSADDGTDTSTQSSGSRATRPPPGFEKHQHVPAPGAVVSLQSANGNREDPATARGRCTAPVSRASSCASSGELDPAILAMLLPKAPEQVLSLPYTILTGVIAISSCMD